MAKERSTPTGRLGTWKKIGTPNARMELSAAWRGSAAILALGRGGGAVGAKAHLGVVRAPLHRLLAGLHGNADRGERRAAAAALSAFRNGSLPLSGQAPISAP